MSERAPASTRSSADGRRYVVVGLLWLACAIVLSATSHTASWRPPIPQLVLAGLTLLPLAAVVVGPHFRRWLATLDLRWLVAVHLTRFVGAYFLILYYRDRALPRAFAVPGGWGDIVVAALALALLAAGRELDRRPRLVSAWNALGLLDVLFVVATAARLARRRPGLDEPSPAPAAEPARHVPRADHHRGSRRCVLAGRRAPPPVRVRT